MNLLTILTRQQPGGTRGKQNEASSVQVSCISRLFPITMLSYNDHKCAQDTLGSFKRDEIEEKQDPPQNLCIHSDSSRALHMHT